MSGEIIRNMTQRKNYNLDALWANGTPRLWAEETRIGDVLHFHGGYFVFELHYVVVQNFQDREPGTYFSPKWLMSGGWYEKIIAATLVIERERNSIESIEQHRPNKALHRERNNV